MIFAEVVIALILAVVFYVFLCFYLKRLWWPMTANGTPLLALFLFIWAGGVWAAPFGPSFQGVYWVPFFATGLTMALLFATATPPWWPPKRLADEKKHPNTGEEVADERKLANGLMWLFFAVLVASIAFRYLAYT